MVRSLQHIAPIIDMVFDVENFADPVIAAVQDRNENRLRSLLQSGADVNGFDPAFGNAMHYIATQGHYQYPPNGIPKV
jgi:hypothetical protein